MIVYRIEGSDGDGPYSGYGMIARQIRAAHQDWDHPGPWADGIEEFREGWDYCGSSTMERLVTWFDGVMNELQLGEYFIARYEVPVEHVKFGVLQLAFDRDEAKFLSKVPV